MKLRIKTFLADGVIALALPTAAGLGPLWASVSESDGGTRLSFPSTDPGREVFQPNAVVGLCHGRASLPARRLRGPCPADRWSSRAPPPCSSRPFLPFSRRWGAVYDNTHRPYGVPLEFDRNASAGPPGLSVSGVYCRNFHRNLRCRGSRSMPGSKLSPRTSRAGHGSASPTWAARP